MAIILFITVTLMLIPTLVWHLRDEPSLVTTIYDKTVTDSSVSQHHALEWFLLQYKYRAEGGEPSAYDIPYLGYHPDSSQMIQDLTPLDSRTDLLYIADTYGVYRDVRDVKEGERNVIWGGTDASDTAAVRAFLNRERASTVIAEYNTFADPTPPYIRSELYSLLGTRWTGWSGFTVEDLSENGDTPSWVREQHRGAWKYEGRGIIIYNTAGEVIILSGGSELGEEMMSFSFTEEGSSLLGLEGELTYTHSFDITEPMASTRVLAEYHLDLNETGEALLASFGLDSVFPAVQLKETANHRSYYFSGNWAYSGKELRLSRVAGMDWLMSRFSSAEDRFTWKVYYPLLKAIFGEAQQRAAQPLPKNGRDVYTDGLTSLVTRTEGSEILLWEEGEWKPLFIQGVNLGIAMPGKWFTEFPQDKSLYYRWFVQMGEMNLNTIRIYTLLDPQFYDAFSLYNRTHPEKPLYLLQEIWPEENPEGHDYLREKYREEFEKEIRTVVDAVHGNADIAERQGRAWGNYTSDVSEYIIGYLVGRELEPQEVEETDALHSGYRFEGAYITTTDEASATESWLAGSCDYLLSYEQEYYGFQHPVSIVNWPTLDYLEHESERDENGEKKNEYNDRTTVNINHLTVAPANKAGLFGSYHIYPNYPDFMNNDPSYDEYEDEKGRFRYGGYLNEFMAEHRNYPAVVAEFGIATGMGNAHTSPDGYNHGGLSEEEQAEGIIRMFEAMKREGYSGGIIFEWMDEWAKKTWTTEPYMIPYDRQILWHNIIDPEQNYGILAYEAQRPRRSGAAGESAGVIRKIELRYDASFLWIDMTLTRPLNSAREQLLIGLDTLDRERGELRYLPDSEVEAPSGMEYLVMIDGPETGRLLAIPESNYTAYRFSTSQGLKREGLFTPLSKLINKERALADGTPIPARYEDSSSLRYGNLLGGTNHWVTEGEQLTLRIPWTRINVSDPSSSTVLDDGGLYYSDPLRDVIQTSFTDAIVVSALLTDQDGTQVIDTFQGVTLSIEGWNQPLYQERLKESYLILKEYLSKENGDE